MQHPHRHTHKYRPVRRPGISIRTQLCTSDLCWMSVFSQCQCRKFIELGERKGDRSGRCVCLWLQIPVFVSQTTSQYWHVYYFTLTIIFPFPLPCAFSCLNYTVIATHKHLKNNWGGLGGLGVKAQIASGRRPLLNVTITIISFPVILLIYDVQ